MSKTVWVVEWLQSGYAISQLIEERKLALGILRRLAARVLREHVATTQPELAQRPALRQCWRVRINHYGWVVTVPIPIQSTAPSAVLRGGPRLEPLWFSIFAEEKEYPEHLKNPDVFLIHAIDPTFEG